MGLDLEKWKSNYYLNNILKLDEVYDEIQGSVNILETAIPLKSRKVTVTATQLENDLVDGIILMDNSTSIIYGIIIEWEREESYSITGDMYIGIDVVNEIKTAITGAKGGGFYIELTTENKFLVGTNLGLLADENATGGDGTLYITVLYHEIPNDDPLRGELGTPL